MGRVHSAPIGLAQAIGRFPERAPLLQHLVHVDEGFRGLCDEYALARASLARFEGRPDAAERPEIAEYRQVIAELEREIETVLNRAQQPSAEGGTMREMKPED